MHQAGWWEPEVLTASVWCRSARYHLGFCHPGLHFSLRRRPEHYTTVAQLSKSVTGDTARPQLQGTAVRVRHKAGCTNIPDLPANLSPHWQPVPVLICHCLTLLWPGVTKLFVRFTYFHSAGTHVVQKHTRSWGNQAVLQLGQENSRCTCPRAAVIHSLLQPEASGTYHRVHGHLTLWTQALRFSLGRCLSIAFAMAITQGCCRESPT